MATKTSTKKTDAKKQTTKKAYKGHVVLREDLTEIGRVYDTENGVIFFELIYGGMHFYNMRLASRKDGGEFVTEPSQENNGRYYKDYFLDLTDKTQAMIIQKVYDKLSGEGDPEDDEDEPEELPFD